MRILISGAAGFLGSHLTDLLLSQGHEVVGVDNFITGKAENIAHLEGNPQYTFVRARRHRAAERSTARSTASTTWPRPRRPIGYVKHQVATLKVNSQGTWNLLELALQKKRPLPDGQHQRVLRRPRRQPAAGDYWGNVNPIGLRSMYDEAKRFSEACTMAYHRERRADTRIIRIFNTYGPRMDPYDGRVVISFIRQALNDEPITVFGDGKQTRSLCYVSDLVRGINLTMESDFHEPINLGNPDEMTILRDRARKSSTLIPGSKSKITHQPMPPDDPKVRCPDITRAKQILGWQPQIDRREGLKRMIEFYREGLKGK